MRNALAPIDAAKVIKESKNKKSSNKKDKSSSSISSLEKGIIKRNHCIFNDIDIADDVITYLITSSPIKNKPNVEKTFLKDCEAILKSLNNSEDRKKVLKNLKTLQLQFADIKEEIIAATNPFSLKSKLNADYKQIELLGKKLRDIKITVKRLREDDPIVEKIVDERLPAFIEEINAERKEKFNTDRYNEVIALIKIQKKELEDDVIALLKIQKLEGAEEIELEYLEEQIQIAQSKMILDEDQFKDLEKKRKNVRKLQNEFIQMHFVDDDEKEGYRKNMKYKVVEEEFLKEKNKRIEDYSPTKEEITAICNALDKNIFVNIENVYEKCTNELKKKKQQQEQDKKEVKEVPTTYNEPLKMINEVLLSKDSLNKTKGVDLIEQKAKDYLNKTKGVDLIEQKEKRNIEKPTTKRTQSVIKKKSQPILRSGSEIISSSIIDNSDSISYLTDSNIIKSSPHLIYSSPMNNPLKETKQNTKKLTTNSLSPGQTRRKETRKSVIETPTRNSQNFMKNNNSIIKPIKSIKPIKPIMTSVNQTDEPQRVNPQGKSESSKPSDQRLRRRSDFTVISGEKTLSSTGLFATQHGNKNKLRGHTSTVNTADVEENSRSVPASKVTRVQTEYTRKKHK
jgi:hypothetical protein